MSDFNISARDLHRNPGRVFEEMTKNAPRGLKTSRSTRGRNPMNLTMFNLSEILMHVPVYDSPQNALERFEAIISGTLGSFWDPDNLPGLSSLIPSDLKDALKAANPDGFGDDGSGEIGIGGGEASIGAGSADARRVISIARNYIGTSERPPGSNRTIFHTATGDAQPNPWCGTFLKAIFQEAGIGQKYMHAATETMRSRFRADSRWGNSPQVGAIAFFFFARAGLGSGRTVSHVGLVERFDNSNIYTIDGNTSRTGGGSQSNGGHVWEKKRARSTVVGYGYPKYGTDPVPGGGDNISQ